MYLYSSPLSGSSFKVSRGCFYVLPHPTLNVENGRFSHTFVSTQNTDIFRVDLRRSKSILSSVRFLVCPFSTNILDYTGHHRLLSKIQHFWSIESYERPGRGLHPGRTFIRFFFVSSKVRVLSLVSSVLIYLST